MATTNTLDYTFKWPAGPKDVILTGNFDNWKGSLPLVKTADGDFEINFPVTFTGNEDKFYFKFIVDGDWTVSNNYKREGDGCGFENNFIVFNENAVTAASTDAKIPEAGGLVSKTNRAPPSTSNRKKGKKKKLKVKKKIRRNKKTGERTIVSQDVEELDSSATNTPAEGTECTTAASSDDEDAITSQSETPAAAVGKQEEPQFHILPVNQGKATQAVEDTTAALQTGPGPVIVQHPEEIKEFSEVRDVNADELNKRLNEELAKEDEQEQQTNNAIPDDTTDEQKDIRIGVLDNEKLEAIKKQHQEEIKEQTTISSTLDPKVQSTTATEPKKTEKEPVADKVEPVVAKPVKKQAATAKTQQKTSEETDDKKKKKSGFFGKLKKLFK